MSQQWSKVEKIRSRFHQKFWARIIGKNHRWRRVDKAINTSNFLYRNWIRIWELCLVLVLGSTTIIFWNGDSTPNNLELVYPLQEVSTVECRTEAWDTLSNECKKELPIIKWANYSAYKNNEDYTKIYSVLYWGNYNDWWDVEKGSHYWVDIATARWTPLYAIANGKVYFAWEQTGYWNVVKIEFVYQWIRYYAIYWHMSSINVKDWDTVSKWQKIWETWNSWVSMWALGGYHVHFEIAKWDSGRPVYAFYGCPDLSKWGIEIINQWLCRTEMFSRTLDPIALLEWANAKLPHPNTSSKTTVSEEHAAAAPEVTEVTKEDREQIIKIAKLYIDSPYVFWGTGSLPWEGTDCSNFTQKVYGNAGIELERSSSEQAYQFSLGWYWYDSINLADVWDLIFFKNTYNSDQEITHVWIYMGNNMMIHAWSSKVEIVTLDNYWKSHLKWIGSFKYLHNNYNKALAVQNYNKILSTPISNVEIAKVTPQEEKKEEKKTVEQNTTNQEHNVANTEEKKITLDWSKLDSTGKAFFGEWNVKVEWDITTHLKKWETRTLKLTIDKNNGDKYNWVLKQPIMFISNSTAVSIEPAAISLVKNWEVEVKLIANQQWGTVFVAINMWTGRMWGFEITIE